MFAIDGPTTLTENRPYRSMCSYSSIIVVPPHVQCLGKMLATLFLTEMFQDWHLEFVTSATSCDRTLSI